MGRKFQRSDVLLEQATHRRNVYVIAAAVSLAGIVISTFYGDQIPPSILYFFGFLIPFVSIAISFGIKGSGDWIERERKKESKRRGGKEVLGLPPQRHAFRQELEKCRQQGKLMMDKYLVGFELNSGKPLWVSDDDLCTHAAVFAKTGVGKTLWLQSLMFQQMARGRASGFTFIDAKRDMGTLADIIMMALMTGRIEDLIVIDPFDPVCSYNFVFTTQRADVKARKVLRCGLPPTSDASTTKHYDRLAADAVYRTVRALESFGLAWSVRDIAVALSAFNLAYPRLRELLHERGQKQALVELGHLAGSYRTAKGALDTTRLTDNLRGIASELHSIANSEAGEMFCVPRADLSLTDAILRGKLIYYMLPRLEEAESAARMVKVFREDLEVSIGEITSNRNYHLEDPHMVIVDEGASTFGPTWANLFELARKGRFALLFGAQSVGGLVDDQMGLSEQFYERVLANVNLKVIMRIGDNRTATDMSEWLGMVATTKKTVTTGLSTGVNARELTKRVEINKRASDAERDAVAMAEDEEELVSPDELKHEMSAEKGLAWFDLGDGKPTKGRAFWFNADLPTAWEGREFLVRYEAVEADEVGLAEWVDEHVLTTERAETEKEHAKLMGLGTPQQQGHGAPSSTSSNAGSSSPKQESSSEEEADAGGPFRFNLMKSMPGRARAKAFEPAPAMPEPPKVEPKSEQNTQQIQEKVDSSKAVEASNHLDQKTGTSENGQSSPGKKSPDEGKKQKSGSKKKGGLKFGGPRNS